MATQLAIKKAEKTQTKLRIALAGPAGAGKTFTALTWAGVLAEGGKIVVIDTESGRASKYSTDFPFEYFVIELPTFEPAMYLEAMKMAYQEGAAVVIIDSLSHGWNGEGGVLEIVDKNAVSNGKRDTFHNGWNVGTPIQTKLMNTIQRAPYHVIATMRATPAYIEEKGQDGRAKIRKVGVKPVQREGVDYEFDLYGMLDRDHTLTVEKSIIRQFAINSEISNPDATTAQFMLNWYAEGKPVISSDPEVGGEPDSVPAAPVATPVAPSQQNHTAQPVAQKKPHQPPQNAPQDQPPRSPKEIVADHCKQLSLSKDGYTAFCNSLHVVTGQQGYGVVIGRLKTVEGVAQARVMNWAANHQPQPFTYEQVLWVMARQDIESNMRNANRFQDLWETLAASDETRIAIEQDAESNFEAA